MAKLFCKTYALLRLIDDNDYVTDKMLKSLIYLQNNQSFSSSCNWLGAFVYLI
ncbi:hypothetical protein [Halalkalibacter krulwichiae]|uniref:hypothetical protein n=1 Tax=Halalkalibacter krulwichiae TaxID=199441 RepID=UPI0012EEB71F|nr:hypothetical protein [Halalkalibacter krulwichiae]